MGVQIRRKQQEIVWKKMFQIAYPERTRSAKKSTYLDIGPESSAGVVSSLAILVHYLHLLHHHVSLTDGFRSRIRLVFRDSVAGEKESRRPRCGSLELRGVELDD